MKKGDDRDLSVPPKKVVLNWHVKDTTITKCTYI